MKAFAIIPAAGRGARFGALKQFEPLAGKPLLLHTLEAFEACSLISGLCLLVPAGEERVAREWTTRYSLKKVERILAGGEERQESVKRGFEAIPPVDIVVVHDGVRPFVTPQLIEQAVLGAQEFGGCIVGLPARETTKRVDSNRFVRETIDRSELWSIQTPQAFRYEIFEKALQKAYEEGFRGTDEAMLVERIGVPIKVIEGSPDNIKVTTPEDLKIAEAILRRKEQP